MIRNGTSSRVRWLENFETNPDADGSDKLSRHLAENYRGKSRNFDVKENEMLIKEALKASRPTLFRGRRIKLVDCRGLNDPKATKHLSTHPVILEATVNNPEFKKTSRRRLLKLSQNTRRR